MLALRQTALAGEERAHRGDAALTPPWYAAWKPYGFSGGISGVPGQPLSQVQPPALSSVRS